MSSNHAEEVLPREQAISEVLAKLFIAGEDTDDEGRRELAELEEFWQNQLGGTHEFMTIKNASRATDGSVGGCEKYVTETWMKFFKITMFGLIEALKEEYENQPPSSARPRNPTPTFSDRSSVSTDSEVVGKIEL